MVPESLRQEVPGDGFRKLLERKLQWQPLWTSHVGCIKGCLDYLGVDVSAPWLFGGTGHAFALNVHEVVCPSGPTAWDKTRFYRLGANLGYTTETMAAHTSQPGFAREQERTWECVRQAIDSGHPCYGWELGVPEYYVVYGYDETGYLFSGPLHKSPDSHKPWQELGNTEIGVIEMHIVRPGDAAPDEKTVGDALRFAVTHGRGGGEADRFPWMPNKTGLAGYDSWIRALESGTALGMGVSFNAEVWAECRQQAVGFLLEAAERLGGTLAGPLREAAEQYQAVAEEVGKVRAAYPFSGPETEHDMSDEPRRLAAAEALRAARQAEESALDMLEGIAAAL